MDHKHIKLISGTSCPEFSKNVSRQVKIPLTPVTVKHFQDGEIYVKIEESVRGCNIFVIQSTCCPVNDNLMELLLIVDALKRGSANQITAILPYYGYSRQDRKNTPREPISARVVADMISTVGVHRVVTFDLHVDQIQGFFDIPSDNLEAHPMLADYFITKKIKDLVVVSPDVGGAKRARRFASLLGTNIAIIDKRRNEHNKSDVMNVVGDVKGMNAILIDDMIDTGGSISKAAIALKNHGAKDVYACATHALFSGKAKENLALGGFKEIVVTDTIPISKEKMLDNIKVISLTGLLAESIKRIYEGIPMGLMFEKIYDDLKKKRA